MRTSSIFVAALSLALLVFSAHAVAAAGSVERAVSADPAVSAPAIAELRRSGPEGLAALLAAYRAEIDSFARTGNGGGNWKLISFAIDSVAMQKDAYASGLFWFTDLETAKAEAAKSGRPILSLRLLGNLNEEFSCANSRFFRALLYSNRTVSEKLRNGFVLHWRSVRPAPKVTIDFGDGRRIERTLTGNSIHYVLDETGRIIDALPGLYSPDSFARTLDEAAEFRRKLASVPANARNASFLDFRMRRFDELVAARTKALADSKVTLTEPEPGTKALEVAPIAVTKMATEAPILRDLDDNFARLEPQIPGESWRKMATNYAAVSLDESSLAFVRRQNPGLSDAENGRLIGNVRLLIALDTTRNDFLNRTRILALLLRERGRGFELESFNSRVYEEIFRTPDSDRWVGLYSTDVYTALDGNGVSGQ